MVVTELREQEPERKVSFVTSGDLHVHADQRLMRVVLYNLLSNAWKFTGRANKPSIQLKALYKDGHHIYNVSDNGAGFDMVYVNKLFGPFQRLHRMVEFPGTGIGLATVQRIIHRHGGTVWAEGEIGNGATFSFTLEPITRKRKSKAQ